MTQIDRYTSEKLRVLSFASIVLVLYIHSGFHEYPNEILGMPFNNGLQQAVSYVLGRLAVPLFFMISGFLFFRNVEETANVWPKMLKRVRTLLVPFVIAALFVPLFHIALDCVPFAARFMNGNGFVEGLKGMDLGSIVSSLFWKTEGGTMPWAYQLWFLRDILLIVALAPVVQVLRNRIGGVFNTSLTSSLPLRLVV